MKQIVSPYIFGLIRENSVYISLSCIVSLLIFFFLPFNSSKLFTNSQTIYRLTKETEVLRKRVNLFNQVSLSKEDLDLTAKTLGALIPNTEDYFSIIFALEKLSQKTSFIITSYTINLKASTKQKLKLSITGTGDQASFLKFLSEYNFGGERLITSDKIELNRQIAGQIKVDLTFYTEATNLTKNAKPISFSQSMLKDLAILKDKVRFDLKEGTNEADLDLPYQKKINPF